jgi:rhamnose transport system permease protein
VASMLGLGTSVFGYAFAHHTGVVAAMVIAVAVGALGGSLNGFLVAYLGLPSIAVTIGTLTMFRGLAEVVLGQNEVTGFPTSLTKIGDFPIFLHIAYPFFFFIVLAAIYAVVVHKTAFGRSLFAIGLNTEAAFFSGIRVKRTKFLLYVISGMICAATGIIYSLQTASSIYTAGTGLELNVVAVVLFGGVSIFGGRGSVLGVVISVVIVGLTEVLFTLINISSQDQQIIFGVLLLLSVVVPNAGEIYRRLHRRVRRVSPPVSAGGGL